MNTIFINIIKKYNILISNLKEINFNFFNIKENRYFFENWSEQHLNLFENLSLEKFEDFEVLNKNFMSKRARMASAFMQGLKTKNNSVQEVNDFKKILKDHDEIFRNLLNDILNYYSNELINVQRFRKVTAAYIHSYQSHGG